MPTAVLTPVSASGSWTNPSNALLFDGAYAVKTPAATSILAISFANVFGLDNVVDGIEVSAIASAYWNYAPPALLPPDCYAGMELAISEDGATPLAGTTWVAANPNNIIEQGCLLTFGNSADLWGAGTITPEQIQSLYILIRRRPGDDGSGVQHLAIDYVDVSVYYTVGSGGGTMIREVRKQLSLIAKESTAGTPVTTGMTQLRRTRFDLDPKPEFRENNPAGEKFISDQILLTDMSEGSIEGEQTYGEMGLLFASLIASPQVVTINASPAVYRHTFRYDNMYRDSIHTFTVQKGDPRTRVEQAAFAIVNSAELKIEGQDCGFSGSLIARALNKDGTIGLGVATVQTLTITGTISYKLVYKGQATSTLTQASDNTAIQTALRALGLIASSSELTVAGASSPHTITFGNAVAGPFKGEPQPLLEVITVSGAGSAVVAMTTAGGFAKIAGPIIVPKNYKVYLAAAYADLAAGQLTQCFVSSIKFGARANPYFVLDSDNSGSFEDYTEPESLAVMLDLTHMADDDGMGLLDNSRDGDTMWVRIVATGEEITSGFNYVFRMEAPFKLKVKPFQNNQGVYAAAYELKNTFSSDLNEALVIELENTHASYG